MAQVMDIGTMDDVEDLRGVVGDARLGEVLRRAEPGWFRPRSWWFWHYRLSLVDLTEKPPPMPERNLNR